MYSNDDIMQFVSLVAEVADPDRIILFGSYAYGEPNDKSDVDILVIKNGKKLSYDEHAGLSTAVFRKRKQHKIGARYDLFFRTDSEVNESVENDGAFVEALKRGRVVYERKHQQERRAIS
ncbi:MAG: nucleotidyltransferase domain-containing protein [Oscillospiraceae bacterium]|nr:nucleotidyltransferase domain-containing protein [Oscillospiraceae bacterium]